jgi:hypothetical protein
VKAPKAPATVQKNKKATKTEKSEPAASTRPW